MIEKHTAKVQMPQTLFCTNYATNKSLWVEAVRGISAHQSRPGKYRLQSNIAKGKGENKMLLFCSLLKVIKLLFIF